jgi:putative tricarboxylic transport membrane protein
MAVLFMIRQSPAKSAIMLALGVALGSVGIDPIEGTRRFTGGSINLSGGFDLVAVVMGLFGVSELLLTVEKLAKHEALAAKIRGLLPTRADWAASWKPILRGSALGFGIGVLPGGNPVTASFVSYGVERKLAKQPERFGKGAIEGVAGPEAANNAAVAGGMVPLLSLGLPSNPITALLLGALIIHNVQPGPLLAAQRPDVFWGVIASMYVGNVMLLILNLPLAGLWVQLLRIPYKYLFPLIVLLAVVGTYSTNKNPFDIWVMIGFGVAGFLLRKLNYELAPLIFALVLAREFENSLRQSLIMSSNGPLIFLEKPIALALILVSAALIVSLIAGYRKRARARNKNETRE